MGKSVKEIMDQLMFERRVLLGCTALMALCVLVWLVAISTDHWFWVAAPTPQGIYINETRRFFLGSHSGLWRICRRAAIVGPTTYAFDADQNVTVPVPGNRTLMRKCKYHEMWPTDAKVRLDPMIDKTILDYTRTEISFSIISLLLMLMGLFFSVYTFLNPRYMFKRLAGGIHFLTCGSVLAVIEVVINSIHYEKKHLPVTFPKSANYGYGFSIVLAWLVFTALLFCGLAFMIYSRKRKGDKAPTEELGMADEPTIIGR